MTSSHTASVSPEVSSRWEGSGENQYLVWTINGEDITDRDLRNWCANNVKGAFRTVGKCILRGHAAAYANRYSSDETKDQL